jgi:hypothetical protein
MSSPFSVSPETAKMFRGNAPEAAAPPEQAAQSGAPMDAQPPPQQSGMAPIGFNAGPQVVPGMSRTAALAKVQQASGEWNRNPDDVAMEERAKRRGQFLREQRAETTAGGMDKQADILGQSNEYQDKQMDERREMLRRQKEVEDAKYKEIEELKKNHDNMKLSDNPYWDNKTSGGKIMAAIGMIGAGFASGLGNNSANQFIQQQIQNSIDAQKQKIAKSADGINQARGMYSDLIRRGYDAASAQQLTTDMGMRKFNSMLKEYGAKTEAAKAHIDALIVPEDEALREARIKNTTADAVGAAAFQLTQPRMVAGGGTGASTLKELKDIDERTVPGIGAFKTTAAAEKAGDMLAIRTTLMKNGDRMATLRGELDAWDMGAGGSMTNTAVQAKYDELNGLNEQNKRLMSTKEGQGALAGQESADYNAIQAQIMRSRGGEASVKAMRALVKRTGEETETWARAKGARQTREAWVMGPGNIPTPVSVFTGESRAPLGTTIANKVQRKQIGK